MSVRKHFVFFTLLVLLLAACGSGDDETETDSDMAEMGGMGMQDMPEDLDTSSKRLTAAGLYRVSVTSNLDPIALNEIHSWTIHVESETGQAVEEATIGVDGGMPQHNHGYPTVPEVTEELGDGDYLLEGMKFSMSGWWELKLDISDGDTSDSVTFNITLP